MSLLAKRVQTVLAPDVLHLILLPTERCNLRCTYCYEDFQLGRMPDEVVQGILALLSVRAPGLRRLDISWFGGEPLLAAPVVFRILCHVEELRLKHPGLEFRSDMTTNALKLEPDLFSRLQALGVTRYQVSFDGTKEEHDSRRVRMDGGGTYERVRGNLLALARLPLEYSIMVRLHVDEKNRHDCFDFVEEFRRDFAGDPRFPLYPRLLSRWGGPGDHTVCPFDEEEGRAVLDEIEDFARSRGVPVRERNGDEPICYAARGNSFVVRSNGRINKCTLALNSTFNDVGAIAEDGTLRLDAARVGAWMRGLWNGSPEELACPMHGLENTSGIRETA